MTKSKLLWIIGSIVVIGGIVWLILTPGKPGKLDAFATCLGEQGAKFYGAFWCPHCQNQKAMFGRSAKKLPYIECSTPDGKGQLPVCNDAGVTGYPTWKFADGSVETGEVSLETLSEKTSCELPQDNG
jgi:hypothetical protein